MINCAHVFVLLFLYLLYLTPDFSFCDGDKPHYPSLFQMTLIINACGTGSSLHHQKMWRGYGPDNDILI